MRRKKLTLIALTVLSLTFAGVLPSAAPPVRAQGAPACVPSPDTACALPFGQPVTAVLTSVDDAHPWAISVLGPVSMRLALTKLPADYGMRVFDPENVKIAENRREGTGGEVIKIPWTGPGRYTVLVAPSTPAVVPSAAPYTLEATVEEDVPPVPSGTWRLIVPGGTPRPDIAHLNEPRGIVVDQDGALFVVESDAHRLQKVTATGQSLGRWGIEGANPGEFNFPVGLARDGQGYIYVADRLNHRIQKFSSAMDPVAQLGSLGAGPGQFNVPIGVAVDGQGNLYVVDRENRRIQKLGPDGTSLAVWGGLNTPAGEFGSLAEGPTGIALDAQGNIYVADTGNHRIKKLSPSGQKLAGWGGQGHAFDEFNHPTGVTVDGAGNIYVADAGNFRIVKLSPEGATIAIWGARGNGPGLFKNPQHLAFDGQGNLYVTDAEIDRIHKFTPN